MNFNEVRRGIPHLEDLPINQIIGIIENLSDYEVTEKLDGAQILFGIDNNGFYTSRETKGGTRIYNESQYNVEFSTTYMRSAHKLLETVLPELRRVGLKPGDQVEAEVLYGYLPNVIPYSADTNYLIFLRTTEGTVNIDHLNQKISDQAVSVSLTAPYTGNGRDIILREETNLWKFSRVPIINKSAHNMFEVYSERVSKFLNKIDILSNQTYGVILDTPLNKIPEWCKPSEWKFMKEYLKSSRETLTEVLSIDYILPLKEELLNHFVRNTGSVFGPVVENGGWIEGVVLRNSSGRMVKLVDKNKFGIIRESAWEKRNSLTAISMSENSYHSFMGKLNLDMATSIGHPELGTIRAKMHLRRQGNNSEEILKNLSEDINFNSIKTYWAGLHNICENQLEIDLDKYAKEADGNSPGIFERTNQAFATSFKTIAERRTNIQEAKISSDLLRILIGKQLGEL